MKEGPPSGPQNESSEQGLSERELRVQRQKEDKVHNIGPDQAREFRRKAQEMGKPTDTDTQPFLRDTQPYSLDDLIKVVKKEPGQEESPAPAAQENLPPQQGPAPYGAGQGPAPYGAGQGPEQPMPEAENPVILNMPAVRVEVPATGELTEGEKAVLEKIRGNIDRTDFNAYGSLSAEERKTLSDALKKERDILEKAEKKAAEVSDQRELLKKDLEVRAHGPLVESIPVVDGHLAPKSPVEKPAPAPVAAEKPKAPVAESKAPTAEKSEAGPEASAEAEELRATRFEGLGDQAKNAMRWLYKKAGVSPGWLYEKSGIQRRVDRSGFDIADENAIDRAKIVFSDQLANWHTSKAAKLHRQLGVQDKLVADLKAKAENSKVFLMRDFYDTRLRSAQRKADDLRSKLEYRNDRRQTYEESRNIICDEYIVRVKEKMAPYDGKIQLAQEKVKEFAGLIDMAQKDRDQLMVRIVELEKQKASVSVFRRGEFNDQIKEIKRTLKDFNAEIHSRKVSQNKLKVQIAKHEQDIAPWKNEIKEMERIKTRRSDIKTGASESAGAEKDKTKEASEKNETKEPEHTGKALVEAWNKRFWGDLRLTDEVAKEIDANMLDGKVKFTKKQFAKVIGQYVDKMLKERKLAASKTDIERSLRMFVRDIKIGE